MTAMPDTEPTPGMAEIVTAMACAAAVGDAEAVRRIARLGQDGGKDVEIKEK